VASAARGKSRGRPQWSLVLPPTLLFRNLGIYAQDSWRPIPRLAITYGLRWDVDFVPEFTQWPKSVGGYRIQFRRLFDIISGTCRNASVQNPIQQLRHRGLGSRTSFAQVGTFQTVLRGGFGVFYDLASSEIGNQMVASIYPFGRNVFTPGGVFPLTPAAAPRRDHSAQRKSELVCV